MNKITIGLQEISEQVKKRSKYRRGSGEMIIPNIVEQIYKYNRYEKMKIQRLPKVQIFEFHDLVFQSPLDNSLNKIALLSFLKCMILIYQQPC